MIFEINIFINNKEIRLNCENCTCVCVFCTVYTHLVWYFTLSFVFLCDILCAGTSVQYFMNRNILLKIAHYFVYRIRKTCHYILLFFVRILYCVAMEQFFIDVFFLLLWHLCFNKCFFFFFGNIAYCSRKHWNLLLLEGACYIPLELFWVNNTLIWIIDQG